jgi:alpha-beta hydrolase superfamily lysophospholipase
MKKYFSYPSANGEHAIHAAQWIPNEIPVKAVLQIAHGMAEHIERYDDFAQYMAMHRIAVYANDHAGHGKSLNAGGNTGQFGTRKGFAHVVEDMYTLTMKAREDYPHLPVFLLGHSMGSFLTREYISHYGNLLSGCILMGTGSGSPFIWFPLFLSQLGRRTARAKRIDRFIFGNYNRKIKDSKHPHDWLSQNKENIQQYIADPLSGFIFTNGAFQAFLSLIKKVTANSWFDKVPSTLPLLLISGAEDPVGNYGKGVEKTYRKLQKRGLKNISLKLYPDMRHEILQETDKAQVYQFIWEWVIKTLNTK